MQTILTKLSLIYEKTPNFKKDIIRDWKIISNYILISWKWVSFCNSHNQSFKAFNIQSVWFNETALRCVRQWQIQPNIEVNEHRLLCGDKNLLWRDEKTTKCNVLLFTRAHDEHLQPGCIGRMSVLSPGTQQENRRETVGNLFKGAQNWI